MLKAARGGIQKTQIMYEEGLSFAQLTAYLPFLVELGLLEAFERNEKIIYKTTAKGKRFVKGFEGIKRLFRKNAEHTVINSSPPFSFPERSA
jgi:predicted transcriptional regulator